MLTKAVKKAPGILGRSTDGGAAGMYENAILYNWALAQATDGPWRCARAVSG